MPKQNQEIATDGSFKRQTNRFTTPFGQKKGSFRLRQEDIGFYGQLFVLGHTVRSSSEKSWDWRKSSV